MFAFIRMFSKTKTDSVRDAFRSYITDAVNVRLFQILHAYIATQKSHLNRLFRPGFCEVNN